MQLANTGGTTCDDEVFTRNEVKVERDFVVKRKKYLVRVGARATVTAEGKGHMVLRSVDEPEG